MIKNDFLSYGWKRRLDSCSYWMVARDDHYYQLDPKAGRWELWQIQDVYAPKVGVTRLCRTFTWAQLESFIRKFAKGNADVLLSVQKETKP